MMETVAEGRTGKAAALLAMLSLLLSAIVFSPAHEFFELSELTAQHEGHVRDLDNPLAETAAGPEAGWIHVFDDHHPEIADHDHPVSSVPQRLLLSELAPGPDHLRMIEAHLPDRRGPGLERPPRA